MTDITLLYCTGNLLPEITAEKIRQNLLTVTENKYPVISVSQKPIDFGENICIGEMENCRYSFFKQMLLGAQSVKTKFIVHVDDDSLYTPEHFTFRPKDEKTFIYNTNTWLSANKLYWKPPYALSGMFCHISPTKALIANLSKRFEMYPEKPVDDRHWGEPGKFDTEFGIPNANVETFKTVLPLVSFEYRGSISGKRKRFGLTDPKSFCYDLEPFGNAKKLYEKYWKK